MAKCFSFTATQDSCYRFSFSRAGLKSSTTDLGDGTLIHCWVPRRYIPSKPTLLMIHGFGANAMWQFNALISHLVPKFNVYVPDLLFFGESYTTRPERSESFQARCVMRLMEAHNVAKMDVFGLSYGGFVAYSMAALFKERVWRMALGCAGVCFEEKDAEEGGVFKVMCTEFRQEKKELIQALHKDRKMSDLPKITQPTLIIWGEHDQVFPLELAHRLERHLGDNAELVIINNVGHALNAERPKELYKHLKSFFIDALPSLKQSSHNNGCKAD